MQCDVQIQMEEVPLHEGTYRHEQALCKREARPLLMQMPDAFTAHQFAHHCIFHATNESIWVSIGLVPLRNRSTFTCRKELTSYLRIELHLE